ncbi:hypothetical protein [Dongia sp.]|uniref:hypothetical protein n=1 Tax=Dongia sp. TaxID=1977262 RepID=UPI0035B39116
MFSLLHAFRPTFARFDGLPSGIRWLARTVEKFAMKIAPSFDLIGGWRVRLQRRTGKYVSPKEDV